MLQDRVWFSKYPSFPGVFPSLRKKPWERWCKVPSPWIRSPWGRGWNRLFLLVSFSFDMVLEKREATIMDKSLGKVVQFERFLTHAKLYLRATSTVRPYPLPPPHRQCWNRQGTIPLIFQHCIRWGVGRGHGFVKRQHWFLRQNLWNA